jgi:hypothetical protein
MLKNQTLRVVLAVAVVVAAFGAARAQSPAPPSGQKTLAATVGVYVFPNAGQNAGQQSQDEGDCYNWAVQNTGSDPFSLAKQSQQQQQQTQQQMEQAKKAGTGAGAAGAVGGAAAGALIGGIAGNDVGHSAAVGAAVGVVAGRRKAKSAQQQATQQAQAQGAQAQQATAQQLDAFKKAFSVCLEAKKYMVKF